MTHTLREAVLADAAQMLPIYNDVVTHSTAIYSEDLWALEDMETYISARLESGFPFLVACDSAGQVRGYATYGPFRPRPGYRFTVEHSVHVSDSCRGQGLGSQLMAALITRARAQDFNLMVGAVDAENEGSLAFHDRLGFERGARLKQVGYKFDRWLDVVFVQLPLKRGV